MFLSPTTVAPLFVDCTNYPFSVQTQVTPIYCKDF